MKIYKTGRIVTRRERESKRLSTELWLRNIGVKWKLGREILAIRSCVFSQSMGLVWLNNRDQLPGNVLKFIVAQLRGILL